MKNHLDQLQRDHAMITAILAAQRELLADGLQVGVPPAREDHSSSLVGVRILLGIYSNILEDALSTLNSLIQYLHPTTKGENDLPNPT